MASVQTGLILESVPSLGNVLKHEYAPEMGYCRAAGIYTVLLTVPFKVGRIVVLDTGKYRDFLDADTTALDAGTISIAVCIDETVYGQAAGDVADVAFLVNGAAIVRQGGLSVGTGTASVATAVPYLIAAGIKVATKFASDVN